MSRTHKYAVTCECMCLHHTFRTYRESWLRLLTKKVMAGGGSWWSSLNSNDRNPIAMCSNFQGLEKKPTILQIVMTPGFNKLIYHSSEFDPQVPVVDAVQQIFNKLLIFSMKMLNSITICTSYIKHKLTLCAKSFQKKVFILFLA